MRRFAGAVLAAVLVAGPLAACDDLGLTAAGGTSSSSSGSGSSANDGAEVKDDGAAEDPDVNAKKVLQRLDSLVVKGRAAKTGYERAAFGQTWADVDRNGCDTRNDILGRDLDDKTFKPRTRNCVVLTGVLDDPYSGKEIDFTRGRSTSSDVQIDHVVALSNAWQTGAARFDEDTREKLANDPLELLAVDGSLNQSKGDGDAATWLPPDTSYRCAYVARQIQVKAKYDLWVTKPEKAAMERILSRC